MSRNRNSSSLKTRRSAILHFWNNGHRSPSAIARLTKIPLRTVKYNITKIKQQGTIEDRPRSGRPRKITAADNKAIGQWIRRNKEVTAKEIAEKLNQERGRQVSRSTVQRQLQGMGYRNTLPYGVPMLTQKQKEARVQWAVRHKDDDWSRTVFTDETSYQLFRNTIRRWSKNPKAEVKRIPKNRQKILAWGGISVKGLVGYYSFKDIMDGPYYIQILENHLIPNARRQFGRHWRLQMDNDPKHRSRIVQDFLREHVPEILDWPSNSPDVNPVENLWSIMKRRVEKRKPSDLDELDQFLHEEWQNIDLSTINNLIKSMKNRCLALITSKGERINY
jgi:transposase